MAFATDERHCGQPFICGSRLASRTIAQGFDTT